MSVPNRLLVLLAVTAACGLPISSSVEAGDCDQKADVGIALGYPMNETQRCGTDECVCTVTNYVWGCVSGTNQCIPSSHSLLTHKEGEHCVDAGPPLGLICLSCDTNIFGEGRADLLCD
jgi:hypothetical protein